MMEESPKEDSWKAALSGVLTHLSENLPEATTQDSRDALKRCLSADQTSCNVRIELGDHFLPTASLTLISHGVYENGTRSDSFWPSLETDAEGNEWTRMSWSVRINWFGHSEITASEAIDHVRLYNTLIELALGLEKLAELGPFWRLVRSALEAREANAKAESERAAQANKIILIQFLELTRRGMRVGNSRSVPSFALRAFKDTTLAPGDHRIVHLEKTYKINVGASADAHELIWATITREA